MHTCIAPGLESCFRAPSLPFFLSAMRCSVTDTISIHWPSCGRENNNTEFKIGDNTCAQACSESKNGSVHHLHPSVNSTPHCFRYSDSDPCRCVEDVVCHIVMIWKKELTSLLRFLNVVFEFVFYLTDNTCHKRMCQVWPIYILKTILYNTNYTLIQKLHLTTFWALTSLTPQNSN